MAWTKPHAEMMADTPYVDRQRALAELIEWRSGFGDQVDRRPRAAGVPQEE